MTLLTMLRDDKRVRRTKSLWINVPSQAKLISLMGGLFFATLLCLVAFNRERIAGASAGPVGLTYDELAALTSETALNVSTSERILVTYAYAESDNARDNLGFFIRHGLHPDVDFVFIMNGETDAASFIPNYPNVRVVHRPNECYDLGSHGEVLRTDDLWKKYTKFIMLNASLRGPFVPFWSSERWFDLFLNRVTNIVKLVGVTMNCTPAPHIQSMLWATDSIGMNVLLDPSLSNLYGIGRAGLTNCYEDHTDAIHGEVYTTRLMRHAGYDVDAMMSAFHTQADFYQWCLDNPNINDFWWEGTYVGINLHPLETIFFKANRGITSNVLDVFTSWYDQASNL